MFGKLFAKISLFFFEEIAKKIAPLFKELEKSIKFTNLSDDVIKYLATSIFFSFLIGFIFLFVFIFVLIKLNILFNFFTFLLIIVISLIFAGLMFIVLYNYPKFVVVSNKKKIEMELEKSIKHLHALNDSNLTVKDILLILQKIDNNKLLTSQSKKILSISNLNKNLKDTIKQICDNTYSEQEYLFFSKLIDVLNNKQTIDQVINEYFTLTEQNIKEKEEHKRSQITLLFEINIFLFFLAFILIFSVFLMPTYHASIKKVLIGIAIVFPVIELILMIILSR